MSVSVTYDGVVYVLPTTGETEWGTDVTALLQAVAANGVSGGAPLSDASPQAIGTVASGVSTDASRADHVHAHGNQLGGTLHADATGASAGFMPTAAVSKLAGVAAGATANVASALAPLIAGVAAVGVADPYSREDHVHPAQTTITGNAGTATALSAGADRTKLDGIAAGATAEVNADFTHAGRITLSSQVMGDGDKQFSDNVGVGVSPTTDLHVEKATAAAGTVQILAKNTTANGLTALTVNNSGGFGASLEAPGTGFSTTGRPTTANMPNLRAGTGTGGLAIQAAASDTPIEFWTSIAGTHAKRGEFRGSDGLLVLTGGMGVGTVFVAADTDYVGRSSNNSILFNATSGDAVVRATGDFYVNIDSNNNETTRKFVIAKDSNASGSGTELFSLTEAGVATITGTLAITSTATMGAVALLSQTNTVAGITNKTFVSATHSGTLALGTTTVSGTPTFSGIVTFQGQNVYLPQNPITAFAGGGQANGTALTGEVCYVTTVATIADSVKLPAVAAGKKITVFNLAANSMNVYTQTGGAINALGANNPIAIAGGASLEFWAQTTTQFRTR